ncbi:hypothetical protein FRB95_006857 [Tulasnella sp. JGI-2019a]|nr:hypothetical protein FRB95_006857 [Tulasnella sp. JGI-2019a]
MPTYPAGFQPVARDPATLPYSLPSPLPSLSLSSIAIPSTPLIEEAKKYLRPELGENVWKHSHRAFLYAMAVHKIQLEHTVEVDEESFYLACLWHDIGCAGNNVNKTKMSFEFWGGITAREWLLARGAPSDVTDSVAETIFRHTDFNGGSITAHGQLIQIGTLFDNIHAHESLLPVDLVKEINAAYPREGWGGCFKDAMMREVELKPWSHATELRGTGEDAWDKIMTNKLEKQQI